MQSTHRRPKGKSKLPENMSHEQHLKYEEWIGEAFAEGWCPHHTSALKTQFIMYGLFAKFVK